MPVQNSHRPELYLFVSFLLFATAGVQASPCPRWLLSASVGHPVPAETSAIQWEEFVTALKYAQTLLQLNEGEPPVTAAPPASVAQSADVVAAFLPVSHLPTQLTMSTERIKAAEARISHVLQSLDSEKPVPPSSPSSTTLRIYEGNDGGVGEYVRRAKNIAAIQALSRPYEVVGQTFILSAIGIGVGFLVVNFYAILMENILGLDHSVTRAPNNPMLRLWAASAAATAVLAPRFLYFTDWPSKIVKVGLLARTSRS